jgi:hypothetical protein
VLKENERVLKEKEEERKEKERALKEIADLKLRMQEFEGKVTSGASS